jgi:hypothetical protein
MWPLNKTQIFLTITSRTAQLRMKIKIKTQIFLTGLSGCKVGRADCRSVRDHAEEQGLGCIDHFSACFTVQSGTHC